jgi:hypothetical protein
MYQKLIMSQIGTPCLHSKVALQIDLGLPNILAQNHVLTVPDQASILYFQSGSILNDVQFFGHCTFHGKLNCNCLALFVFVKPLLPNGRFSELNTRRKKLNRGGMQYIICAYFKVKTRHQLLCARLSTT